MKTASESTLRAHLSEYIGQREPVVVVEGGGTLGPCSCPWMTMRVWSAS